MDHFLKAEDLLPLISKLSAEERARLIKLARLTNDVANEQAAYAALPVRKCEFSSDEDLLGWDSEGWENFGRSG
jgi:hypothetical protein